MRNPRKGRDQILPSGNLVLCTYLQSLLALHAPPRRQRLGEPGERLVREPGLVVEDVEDLLQVVLVLLHVELRVGDEHALALLLLEPHHSCQEEVVGRYLKGDLKKHF